MAFQHRKLLNESADDLSDYCAAVENPSGICPLKCIDSCPSLCKLPTLVIPQPPPTPPPVKYPRLSLLLTASLAALAASFFLFTCYTIYRIYTNWCAPRRRIRRQRRHPERDGVGPEILPEDGRGPAVDHHIWYIQTVGLHPSVIGAITIVRYKKGEGLIDGMDCSVCLNEFQEDETLRLLPKCSHAFHVPCIDTWLRSHTNCPLCRAGIVADPAIQAQNSHISGPGPGPDPEEETRLGLSGRISRRVTDVVGSESESSELEIGIIVSGDEMVSEALNGPKADVDGPMRRSISVNSLSVMDKNLIYPMFVESIESECRIVGVNRGMLRLVETQTGSSFMKRSVSCSGNVFVPRHGANKNRN